MDTERSLRMASRILNLVLLLLTLVACGQGKKKVLQPNFIIILADDLGYADLSMNGSKQIRTPNIDKLSETGATMTQGYVSSAVCAPSRAGLLTGKNQVEFGFDNNLAKNQKGFDPEFGGLPVDQKTIATRLSELGYATGVIGKWHLGHEEQFHPLNRGFDEFWGYLGGGHDYFEWQQGATGRRAPIICNFKEPQQITYITDDKGDECISFIDRHKKEPFFLYASFNAPHAPMQATNEDLERYSHIKDLKRRTYAAMVHRLDVNLGRIIDKLEAEGLREKTLVVFLSDNGGPCDQNYSLNAPLNGQKGILLEGGIRVPFVFNWPEMVPAGKKYEHLVSSLDLAPTMFQLAGGEVVSSEFTGVNLMPYLKGENRQMPHPEMMWKFTISTAIREGDWKLVRIPDRLPMLYHLPSDISEQNNVALDNLEVTRRLLKSMGEWEVALPHPVFLEGAEWKKKQLDLYDVHYILEQPE